MWVPGNRRANHRCTLRDLLGHKTIAMAERYVREVGLPVREARERAARAIAAMMDGTAEEEKAASTDEWSDVGSDDRD